MIDFIDGELAYIYHEAIVVKVYGVGYHIFCPDPRAFGAEGTRLRVFTHQHVREDFIGLYGFPSVEERELFRQLLNVSSIGPKVALGILSAGEPAAVVRAIYEEDYRYLTKLPGVGKKTAQRIVLDLKDKLSLDVWLNDMIAAGRGTDFGENAAQAGDAEVEAGGSLSEAREALMQLGYTEKEASRAVQEAAAQLDEENVSVDILIRQALQAFLPS
ncbi:Holliday junction branch migration protein RuvA [Numidum massiliense]|uniref:Holliday junction branch migration protein RuvA n=1 Tax=Numidum massiliense TaxID=1522315 RepID=UPI0006D56D72|nr:Holliday junction branch migration protein RuvA [Numidum massiliense]